MRAVPKGDNAYRGHDRTRVKFLRGAEYETCIITCHRGGGPDRRRGAGDLRSGGRADHADDFRRRHAGGAVQTGDRALRKAEPGRDRAGAVRRQRENGEADHRSASGRRYPGGRRLQRHSEIYVRHAATCRLVCRLRAQRHYLRLYRQEQVCERDQCRQLVQGAGAARRRDRPLQSGHRSVGLSDRADAQSRRDIL